MNRVTSLVVVTRTRIDNVGRSAPRCVTSRSPVGVDRDPQIITIIDGHRITG